MATKQQIFVNNTLPTDKLLAGNGTDTLSEITLGSGLSLSSGTLTAMGGGGGSLIPLTTTFADCENTASEIDIVTATIPANILAVGDIIRIELYIERLQNSGGTIVTTQRVKNATNTIYILSATTSNNASVHWLFQTLLMHVIDITSTTVTLQGGVGSSLTSVISYSATPALSTTNNANGATTTNYTNNNTFDNTAGTILNISAQWASANANAYVRVENAQAYIIKKAI